MATTASTIAIVFDAIDRATPTVDRIGTALTGVDTKAGEIGRGMGEFEGKTSAASRTLESMGAIARAAFGAFTVAELTRQFIDANAQIEGFARVMSTLTGSTSGAQAELGYVRDVSNRLGIELRATSDAWVSMAAAAKGTALEGEPSRRVFEAISHAMSTLGKSSSDTQGALLAVQQIISKGSVSSEELRGQLGERLPGAFQIAARAVGVTTSELGNMLKAGDLLAQDFLPKFADEINKTFGDPTRVDTYAAAVNRLSNAVQIALQDVGTATGGLTTSLVDYTTKLVQESGAIGTFFARIAGAARDLARGGDLDTFRAQFDLARDAAQQMAGVIDADVNESMAETARLARSGAAETGDYSAEMAKFARQGGDATKQVADAFEILGIKQDKVKDKTGEYIQALTTLVSSSDVKGRDLANTFDAVLKKLDTKTGLDGFQQQLGIAFRDGKISAEDFNRVLKSLGDEYTKLAKSNGQKAFTDAAKEAEKAAEKAQAFKVEMEKLASNERIKTLEFRATLEVERIKGQTEQVKAAFDSLNTTVESTADVINKSFGLLASKDTKWEVRTALESQIDAENKRRDKALDLQSNLTQAQIDLYKAQAAQLESGDAIIKIDGSGLAPHLEAFMWEILKAVQVRASRDSAKLLLGL